MQGTFLLCTFQVAFSNLWCRAVYAASFLLKVKPVKPNTRVSSKLR